MLLVALVIGLQYAGTYYAIQVSRISREAELDRYLRDLGRLAESMLARTALDLADLALYAPLEERVMREHAGGRRTPSARQIYKTNVTEELTRPIAEFDHRTRLRQVLVLSSDGRVLYDSEGQIELLRPYDFWEIDQQEVASARLGQMATTPVYRAEEDFVQRSYVPIIEPDLAMAGEGGETERREVSAIVCLVAGDNYLGLADLTRHLQLASFVLTILMALIGLTIWRLISRQRRAELQAAENDRLAGLGRLAAGFAHELRNPLGIIRAFTEDLRHTLRQPEPGDEAFDACDEIIEEVDRLNRLVEQFLSYSRGGRLDQPAGECAALDAVESVLSIVRPLAEKRGLRLVVEHGAPREEAATWRVALALPSLRQILMNLLLNAVEVSPQGGTVRVRLEAAGRRVRLMVLDEGPGIGPAEKSRVFEPFYTTRESGAGLGLAISRQIATTAGGSLEVGAPAPGGGACLVLTLKRGADRQPAQHEPAADQAAERATPALPT